jgi:hypothetical protein
MKRTIRKLSLSRETLIHLDALKLGQIVAGSIISSDNKECTYTRLGFETSCWC